MVIDGTYLHPKSGVKYKLLMLANEVAGWKHPHTAVYKSLVDGKIYARPVSEFEKNFKFVSLKDQFISATEGCMTFKGTHNTAVIPKSQAKEMIDLPNGDVRFYNGIPGQSYTMGKTGYKQYDDDDTQ